MKPLNNHGVYDHSDAEDQKAMFKARLIIVLIMIACLSVLIIACLYLKRLNDHDKRTEYIEQSHSELK